MSKNNATRKSIEHLPNTSKIKFVTAATTLKVYEQNCEITGTNPDAFDITLPPVELCAGEIFSFYRLATGVNAIGVLDANGVNVGVDLDAATESLVCMSNGYRWFVVNQITA